MPELAGVGIEPDLSAGLRVLQCRLKQAGEPGAVERVVVAAFG